MGGLGPGHKSERARQARLVNMAKARAARKREPLRWRSGLESRIIEQLVWQWWLTARGEGRGRGNGRGAPGVCGEPADGYARHACAGIPAKGLTPEERGELHEASLRRRTAGKGAGGFETRAYGRVASRWQRGRACPVLKGCFGQGDARVRLGGQALGEAAGGAAPGCESHLGEQAGETVRGGS